MRNNVLNKIIVYIDLFLVVLIIGLLTQVPFASGYEISIYDIYPIYFWVLLGITLFVSAWLFLISTFKGGGNNLWKYGFFSMIIVNLILVSMPLIRKYFFYGIGDPLTHVFHTMFIINKGHIDMQNIYPASHVLGSELSYVLGITPFKSLSFIPPLLYLFYLLSTYLFLKNFFKTKKAAIFCLMLLALPLQVSSFIEFYPNTLAFTFYPIIFYIIFSQSINFKQKLMIELPFFVIILLFHIMTALYLFVLLFILIILTAFFTKKHNIPSIKNHFILKKLEKKHILIFISAGVLIFYILCITASSKFFRRLLVRFRSLFSNTPQISSYLKLANWADATPVDIIKIILLRYGQIITLFFLAFIVIFMAIKNRKRCPIIDRDLIFLIVAIIFFICISLFSLLSGFKLAYSRVFKFLNFFIPIFVTFGLYKCNKLPDAFKRVRLIFISIFLILLIAFSIINAIPSPIIKDANHQETLFSFAGATWFFEKNNGLETFRLGCVLNREFDAYGKKGLLNLSIENNGLPPSHFMYDQNPIFGSNFKNDKYMSIYKLGRIRYQKVWPEYKDKWRFTPVDFRNMEEDYSIYHIYANGESDFYYIRGFYK